MIGITVTRDYFVNEALGKMSFAAQWLHLALRVLADDRGRFVWNPSYIHQEVAPYRTENDVQLALIELLEGGAIGKRTFGGQDFGEMMRPHNGLTEYRGDTLSSRILSAIEDSGRTIDSLRSKEIEGSGGKEKTRKSKKAGRPPTQPYALVASVIDEFRQDYVRLVDPGKVWAAVPETERKATTALLNLYGLDRLKAMWAWAMQDKCPPRTGRDGRTWTGWSGQVRSIAALERNHDLFDSGARNVFETRAKTPAELWDEQERKYQALEDDEKTWSKQAGQ